MATFTFTNTTGMAIVSKQVAGQNIDVFGLFDAITNVDVRLIGLTHTFSNDLEMLLVGPDGMRGFEFWSDVGGGDDLNGNYVVSDSGAAALPNGTGIVAGTTYKPADYEEVETSNDFGGLDVAITHAGPNGSGTMANAFANGFSNGRWRYLLKDSGAGDDGHLDGWGLTITTNGSTARIAGYSGEDDIITVKAKTGESGTYAINDSSTVSYAGVNLIVVEGDTDQLTETQITGEDTITADVGPMGFVVGDLRVSQKGEQIAGNDIIRFSGAGAFGDALDVLDFLVGGDDIIAVSAGKSASLIGGDANAVGSNGRLVGGNDTITDGNAGTTLVGDAVTVANGAFARGGADTIHGGGEADDIYGDWKTIGTGPQRGGNDKLYGDAGSDTIHGNGGNDLLDGGSDADTMIGGAGNDTYVIDNAADVVDETEDGSDGVDTVQSLVRSIDMSIATLFKGGIEKGLLLGSAALNLKGNGLVNTLTGNSNANTIDGGAGADQMGGKGGNDTYIVDDLGDRVFESANGGADTVKSAVHFSLIGQAIETLLLTGTAAIRGTGNELANTITGNRNANTIDGGTGADVLSGAAGKDSFVFSTKLGSANIDRITDFSVADDTMRLENAVFAGLAAGALADVAFKVLGTSAVDNSDRVLYNATTGALFFDKDGSGTSAAVQFATLDNKAALTHADFFVI